MKFRIFIALALLSLGVLIAEDGISNDSILIGISNAQSGPALFLGTELSKGAQAYFNYVNDNGGINGKKIKVIQYDDGYEPKRCTANTNKLIANDKVFALFGYVGTPTCKAAAPMIQRAKVPFFFPFTGAGFLRDTSKFSYTFNLRATYDIETEAMVDYLVKKGSNKIAIFIQADAYGRAGLDGVNKALSKRNMKLAAEARYQRNTVDVSEAVSVMKKNNPDAIIMIGAYKPCAEFIKQAKKSGMTNVEFLNISFVGSKALAKELGATGDGVIITQCVPSPWDDSIPVVKEYKKIMKQYSESFTPGFVSLEGFLNAKLFVKALKKSNLTREGLVTAIQSIKNHDLGSGDRISYSATDHQGFERIYMTEIKNGKFIKK
ncbi:MAG: ABC transporter substrate-binding protein [Candidatus Cloacimonetes bacterium]|nr:ABC transporter substrate-binding protein [Candidatus Cloacimonadota bacterium]